MYLKAICCEVLARLVYYAAALSPHVVDVELLGKGLHNEPDDLRSELQLRLDAVEEVKYDAILLGYGLCSNSIAGLVCAHTKLVVPRAHDCITLYLGSGERYSAEFRANPGTYWYSADYIERGSDGDYIPLGSDADQKEMSRVYQEYVEKYGRDNADYLMEVMGAWRQHYSRAAYIDTAEVALPDYSEQVRQLAAGRGWSFERLVGSLAIMRALLAGQWSEGRFLIVPPGYAIVPTNDERILSVSRPQGQ